MRIGFDARMITHPGIGRYMKNLLQAVFELNTGHDFILYGNKEKLSAIRYPLSAVQIINYNIPIYSFGELFAASVYAKDNIDVLHVPHFNAPLQKTTKLVVTVHDLIYIKFRQSSSYFRSLMAPAIISHSLKKADKIIAVSEHTKKDILHYFKNVNADKIKVIYEAADPCFRKIADKTNLTVKQKYNLPDKFILFVGSLKYHKNLEGAAKAFNVLKNKLPGYKFVITGRPHKREAYIEKNINSADILYLHEVDSDDLVGIYNLASCLLHPSFYEGFGLTILEAFACGVPVVCSNTSSLPEICSDAAVLADPNNIVEMAEALYNVLTDTKLKEALINKGFERVKEFSWKKCAEETLKIYEEVI